MCVGRLTEPTDHFPHTQCNTHCFCLADDDNKLLLDLHVNWGDLWQFVLFFNVIAKDDGRQIFITTNTGENK